MTILHCCSYDFPVSYIKVSVRYYATGSDITKEFTSAIIVISITGILGKEARLIHVINTQDYFFGKQSFILFCNYKATVQSEASGELRLSSYDILSCVGTPNGESFTASPSIKAEDLVPVSYLPVSTWCVRRNENVLTYPSSSGTCHPCP